jgi:hypothetical protein
MTNFQIAFRRLRNQRLSQPDCVSAVEVVSWLGAVQAQDFYGAKWAVGQRMRDATDDAVEQAFAAGEILRTHILRPTWHFVTPKDIRWLLALTAPRIMAASSSIFRKLELDDVVAKRSRRVLERTLAGGKQLTREELRAAWERAGIATNDLRLIHLLLRAEVDGVICSGGRRGKQFTYTLLDERAPASKAMKPAEPLAELAKRYFDSRGPATLQDFVWWSGLTVTDARKGLELVQRKFLKEKIDGKEYWFADSNHSDNKKSGVQLLPAFDEFLVAYKDRSAVLPVQARGRDNPLFGPAVVIEGQVTGIWKRTLRENSVEIQFSSKPSLAREAAALKREVKRYAAFLGLAVASLP